MHFFWLYQCDTLQGEENTLKKEQADQEAEMMLNCFQVIKRQVELQQFIDHPISWMIAN